MSGTEPATLFDPCSHQPLRDVILLVISPARIVRGNLSSKPMGALPRVWARSDHPYIATKLWFLRLFDYLVSDGEQRRRHGQPGRFGGLEVDQQ